MAYTIYHCIEKILLVTMLGYIDWVVCVWAMTSPGQVWFGAKQLGVDQLGG